MLRRTAELTFPGADDNDDQQGGEDEGKDEPTPPQTGDISVIVAVARRGAGSYNTSEEEARRISFFFSGAKPEKALRKILTNYFLQIKIRCLRYKFYYTNILFGRLKK